jgi:hypothetical protein
MAECKELRSDFARADQTDVHPAELDENIYATEEGKYQEVKRKISYGDYRTECKLADIEEGGGCLQEL